MHSKNTKGMISSYDDIHVISELIYYICIWSSRVPESISMTGDYSNYVPLVIIFCECIRAVKIIVWSVIFWWLVLQYFSFGTWSFWFVHWGFNGDNRSTSLTLWIVTVIIPKDQYVSLLTLSCFIKVKSLNPYTLVIKWICAQIW